MNNEKKGIVIDATEDIITQLTGYSFEIKESLTTIDNLINSAHNSFKSDISKEFYSKYENIAINVLTINQNMESYINDVKGIIVAYGEKDILLSKKIDNIDVSK